MIMLVLVLMVMYILLYFSFTSYEVTNTANDDFYGSTKQLRLPYIRRCL